MFPVSGLNFPFSGLILCFSAHLAKGKNYFTYSQFTPSTHSRLVYSVQILILWVDYVVIALYSLCSFSKLYFYL